MTDSPLPEILAAGEFALEYTHGRLDEPTVQEIVDVVGRAVLHAAAEKQRAQIAGLDLDDHWAVFYRSEDVEKLPDLIDPPEET